MAQNRCKPLGKPLQCEVQQAARLPSDRRNVLYCATSIAIFSLCHIKIFLLVYWFVLPKLSADKSLWVHDLWAKRARARRDLNKQTNRKSQTVVFCFLVFCSPLSYNFLVKFTNGTNKFSHFSLPAIQIWPGSELLWLIRPFYHLTGITASEKQKQNRTEQNPNRFVHKQGENI